MAGSSSAPGAQASGSPSATPAASLLVLARPSLAELDPIRELVERHKRATASPRAAALLARWDKESGRWWRAVPRADIARLERDKEGTGARDGEGAQAAGVGA